MKVKLLRDLWNKKAGAEIEVENIRGQWCCKKGYAKMIEDAPENKAEKKPPKNKKG